MFEIGRYWQPEIKLTFSFFFFEDVLTLIQLRNQHQIIIVRIFFWTRY